MSSSSSNATTTTMNHLLWASTGGGWRAMFADVGYVNVFAQAGLFTPTSCSIDSISTVSGGSWFSTQLFYSQAFYNATANAASTPEDIYNFVIQWMGTYYDISSEDDLTTSPEQCDYSKWLTDGKNPQHDEMVTIMEQWCQVLIAYDYDWALFIQTMLKAAADEYGTPGFVDILAIPSNIIAPLAKTTDLLIQASLAPNARIRNSKSGTTTGNSTAVYLGYEQNKDSNNNENSNIQLLTPAISAAWIIDTQQQTARFQYGVDDLMMHNNHNENPQDGSQNIHLYTGPVPNAHSWDTWEPFYLYQGNGTTSGQVSTNNTNTINATYRGTMRTPFGYNNANSNNVTNPTVLQVAAASSAAAGSSSPLVPSAYTQTLSIGYYTINENVTKTVWRVLAGLAAGIGAGILLGWIIAYLGYKYNCCRACQKQQQQKNPPTTNANDNGNDTKDNDVANNDNVDDDGADNNDAPPPAQEEEEEENPKSCSCSYCQCERPARNWGIACGILVGIFIGLVTALFYGTGSILVPKYFNEATDKVYANTSFDNFAVCSQWPNLPCGEDDAYMMDGWYVDNPAVPINIGHHQQKMANNNIAPNEVVIKVLLSNCDQDWNTEYTQGQYLAYYSTYFNQGIAPGGFLWGPGWYMPSRSQQIFEEYLDPEGLNALIEPIENSNMTTARLSGTTIDNPAFQVQAGQRVEMLLMNLNANITTYVVGASLIANFTEPLAEMASHIAGSEELVKRVRAFVAEGNP